MRDATANSCEEFEVYYQPVIDISGEKERCSGVEALVRWNSGKWEWSDRENLSRLQSI